MIKLLCCFHLMRFSLADYSGKDNAAFHISSRFEISIGICGKPRLSSIRKEKEEAG